eukprot:gene10952-13416_t
MVTGNKQFEENYVLANDLVEKEKLLSTLIGGSPDYYYYNTLHLLNVDPQLSDAKNKTKFNTLLKDWSNSSNLDHQLYESIDLRSKLLTYKEGEQSATDLYTKLKHQLGLSYPYGPTWTGGNNDQQEQQEQQESTVNNTLDPKSIERDTLIKNILTSNTYSMDQFEFAAYPYIANNHKLSEAQLKQVLNNITYPVLDNLVDELSNSTVSRNRPIDSNLTISQMDKIASAKPAFLDDRFVTLYLNKLQPGSDNTDWRQSKTEQEKYYKTAYKFVHDLPESLNSFKFVFLYHYITFQISQGIYEESKFLEYIQLPREPASSHLYIEKRSEAKSLTKYHFTFDHQTFAPVTPAQDQELIKLFLTKVFLTESSTGQYSKYFRPSFIDPLFAEVKLTSNAGTPEKWIQMIDNHSLVQEIKDRAVIQFSPENPKYFHPDDAVEIKCAIKNVQHLIVKLFEISTLNYYKKENKQIDTNINLDGLVASEEFTFNYTETPVELVQRSFKFPSLKSKRGIFVLEFIGNGKSSRALIKKGVLNFVSKTDNIGQLIKVLDEDSIKILKSSVYIDGNRYTSNDEGDIIVPFTSRTSNKSIILMTESFATLSNFEHLSESYSLSGGIFVENGSLLQGEKAPIVVRGKLFLGSTQISNSLLEEPTLHFSSVDNSTSAIQTTKEVKSFVLKDNEESVFLYKVPENASEITIRFEAKVRVISRGNNLETLSFNKTVKVNSINDSQTISDVFLRYTGEQSGYKLYYLGKGGEPMVNSSVSLELKHWMIRDINYKSLTTDKNGIINLGNLDDIDQINVSTNNGQYYNFKLNNRNQYSYPNRIHSVLGEPISLPCFINSKNFNRSFVNLFEISQNGTVSRDFFSLLKLEKGELSFTPTNAGRFKLILNRPTPVEITVEVCEGSQREGFIVGPSRILGFNPSYVRGLIFNATVDKNDQLLIQLKNYSSTTRVHLISSYFVPNHPGEVFDLNSSSMYCHEFSKPQSYYFNGRELGDEINYILNRKTNKKHLPGNSLKKPSLLLQPWSVATTTQSKDQLKKGGNFESVADSIRPAASAITRLREASHQQDRAPFLEFLETPSLVLTNLVPNQDGLITVPVSTLKASGSLVSITAIDNDVSYASTVSLEDSPIKFKETKLVRSLDANTHYNEKKLISTVQPGQLFEIENTDSSRYTIYDSLDKALSLLKTLAKSNFNNDFSFIGDWPSLSFDQKKEKYSKYNCHELNFFIYKKDKEFFEKVVLKYVQSKANKTFLDFYLTGNHSKLNEYLSDPQQFRDLNSLEKVLLAEVFPEQAKNIESFFVHQTRFQPIQSSRYDSYFTVALNQLDSDKASEALVEEEQKEVAMDDEEMEGGGGYGGIEAMHTFGGAPRGAYKSRKSGTGASSKSMAMETNLVSDLDMMVADQRLSRMAAPAPQAFFMASAAPPPMPYQEVSHSRARRNAPNTLYQQIEKTEEWAETNYYKVRKAYSELVPANEFWRDYATFIAQQGSADAPKHFLSKYFAHASSTLTEIIVSLAVLELPFQCTGEYKSKGGKLSITPSSSIVVFHQELVSGKLDVDPNVFISQHFFDPNGKYSYESGEQTLIYIKDEFISSKIYGANIVVANLSSKQKKFDILLQIPKGAIPVGPSPFTTRTHSSELLPYSNVSVEYFFYFPSSGSYPHFPTHVSEKGVIIGAADPFQFKVVPNPTIVNQLSWEYIANKGSAQDILQYLEKENLNRVELYHLYHRFFDQSLWLSVISLFRQKKYYNHEAWSFALYHQNTLYSRQYLSSQRLEVGPTINSPLLSVDPLRNGDIEYLEYAPLVNARTHKIGGERKILNQKFSQQYQVFCNLLSFKLNPTDFELMALAYYLLLQDRYEDAVKIMNRIGKVDEPEPIEIEEPMSPQFSTPSASTGDSTPTSSAPALSKEEKKKKREEEKRKEKEEKRIQKEENKKRKEEEKKKKEDEKRAKKLAKKQKVEGGAVTPSSSTGAAVVSDSEDDGEPEIAIDISSFDPPSHLPELEIQYDYLVSYLDFFNANPSKSKEIADKYTDYPVKRWNELYRDLKNKINQVSNVDSIAIDYDNEIDRDRRQSKMASNEPSFDINAEGNQTISVNYTNVTELNVSYYIMDIELLFSTNPFVQQELGQFLYVTPNKKESFPLQSQSGTFTFNIPKEFLNSNIVIDCQFGQIHRNLTIYSNSLAVHFSEKAGQLRVIQKQTRKPISKVYVKVYSKGNDGKVNFWKDGYTDIAGFFDYSSVSDGNISDVSKLSILILSNEYGAVIREISPPAI